MRWSRAPPRVEVGNGCELLEQVALLRTEAWWHHDLRLGVEVARRALRVRQAPALQPEPASAGCARWDFELRLPSGAFDRHRRTQRRLPGRQAQLHRDVPAFD